MNKTYKLNWTKTALDELSNILAYPLEVKERIFLDSFKRSSVSPFLTANQITFGELKGYWVRLGLYQVMVVFEVNEEESTVWIDGIKYRRENVYWKNEK